MNIIRSIPINNQEIQKIELPFGAKILGCDSFDEMDDKGYEIRLLVLVNPNSLLRPETRIIYTVGLDQPVLFENATLLGKVKIFDLNIMYLFEIPAIEYEKQRSEKVH